MVLQLIAATTSKTGLRVHAQPDTGSYPTKQVVTDSEMADVRLQRHPFHGEWNYTLNHDP